MDTLSLTILMFSGMCAILGVLALIELVLKHLTRTHLFLIGSLLSSAALLGMFAYALWTTFGWWTLAILSYSIAHGVVNSWVIFNSVPKNWDLPIYRETNEGTYGPRIR